MKLQKILGSRRILQKHVCVMEFVPFQFLPIHATFGLEQGMVP